MLIRRAITLLLCLFCVHLVFGMTKYGPTKKGDTLWQIAMNARADKQVNIDRMIQAIAALNASSIHAGDTLRLGAYLTVPTTTAEINRALRQQGVASGAKQATSQPVKGVMKKADYEQQMVKLKQQLQVAQHQGSARASQVSALNQQLTQAQSKIQMLEEEVYASKSHFPWAWFWFVVLFASFGYLFYQNWFDPEDSASKGMAAARLGIRPGDRVKKIFRVYPTEKMTDHSLALTPTMATAAVTTGNGSAMADAMIDLAEGDSVSARERITGQIERDPKNIALRMKLLETYVAENDREAFKQESDYLLTHLLGESDPEFSRIQSMYLRKWVYD